MHWRALIQQGVLKERTPQIDTWAIRNCAKRLCFRAKWTVWNLGLFDRLILRDLSPWILSFVCFFLFCVVLFGLIWLRFVLLFVAFVLFSFLLRRLLCFLGWFFVCFVLFFVLLYVVWLIRFGLVFVYCSFNGLRPVPPTPLFASWAISLWAIEAA